MVPGINSRYVVKDFSLDEVDEKRSIDIEYKNAVYEKL
jgi:hypothetical protein